MGQLMPVVWAMQLRPSYGLLSGPDRNGQTNDMSAPYHSSPDNGLLYGPFNRGQANGLLSGSQGVPYCSPANGLLSGQHHLGLANGGLSGLHHRGSANGLLSGLYHCSPSRVFQYTLGHS